MKKQGLLLILSGPSGSGKGTIVEQLKAKDDFALSISATTRAPREYEQDGVHYFFRTREEFERMIANQELLEWAEFCGNCYGTPRAYVTEQLQKGQNVILEIEVQGARQIKEKRPDCVSIFVLPPSLEELEKRLRYRNTEDEETIQKRLAVARQEMETARDYDYVIVNDTIEHTVEQINKIIAAEKLKVSRAKSNIERVLNND